MIRRQSLLLVASIVVFGLGGCSWWNGLTMRSQSPEPEEPKYQADWLVGDVAVPLDPRPVRIEGVGLVTGLHNTGSDPAHSSQRGALLAEMRTHKVDNPNTILASRKVSLVMVQGYLRPGIQKGDRFDIEIRVPSGSETTSLRGGYLLETRLQETALLGNQFHYGALSAVAKGPVLVTPTGDPQQDRIMLCRGRVLGGGVARKSRPLGLVILPEYKHVRTSSHVATAINKRFCTYDKGLQIGVAKAKTDEFIELSVHPRYKDNTDRYFRVVGAVRISESAHERMQRIVALQAQLLDPETAEDAAWQLEAIGPEAADTLCKALDSKNTEVRFYAAEALAYLDRREAAEPLGQIARDEPAFRVFALTALSTMQDFAACEQLRDLLSAASAETRYGAFRALWTMNQNHPLVKGELLGGQFRYHVLNAGGPPMVHVTRSRLAEVVLFDPEQRLLTPLAVNAGNEIMVTSSGGDEIAVSKYTVKDGDQKRVVTTRLDDVIRAIVELGGAYPDVVQALQEAKGSGALAARFEVDALPRAGRTYDRLVGDEGASPSATDDSQNPKSAKGSPDLFAAGEFNTNDAKQLAPEKAGKNDKDADADEGAKVQKGFLARLFGR